MIISNGQSGREVLNSDGDLKCIGLQVTYVGARDASVIRGKELSLNAIDRGLILEAAGKKLRAHEAGASLRDSAHVLDTKSGKIGSMVLQDTFDDAYIENGWETERYLVQATFEERLSANVREVIVIQGFTDNNALYEVEGGNVYFDLDATVNMNKISVFREKNNEGLFPILSHNIILDRWETIDEVYSNKPTNIFSNIDLRHSQFSKQVNLQDETALVNGSVDTIDVKSLNSRNYINKLINASLDGCVELVGGSNSNTANLAATRTVEESIHTNRVIEEIMKFFYDDMSRTISPVSFEMEFIDAFMENMERDVEIIDTDYSDDSRYIDLDSGAIQESVSDNSLEVKISSAIAEMVGAALMRNQIKSISMIVVSEEPCPENDYNEYGVEHNVMIEFIVDDLPEDIEDTFLEKCLDEIGEEVDEMVGQYYGYYCKIEVLGLAFCEVHLGIGDNVIAGTHSMFADSLSISALSTKDQFDSVADHTAKLLTEIGREVAFSRRDGATRSKGSVGRRSRSRRGGLV